MRKIIRVLIIILLGLEIIAMVFLVGIFISKWFSTNKQVIDDTVFELHDKSRSYIKNSKVEGSIKVYNIAPPSVTEISQVWIGLDVEGKGMVEFKGKVQDMSNVFKLAHIVAKNMRWKVRAVLFDIRPMDTARFIQAHDYSELLLKCL
jgi:hypothetical protein